MFDVSQLDDMSFEELETVFTRGAEIYREKLHKSSAAEIPEREEAMRRVREKLEPQRGK